MPEALESRVIRSAEAAFAVQKYAGALDVLSRMGLVAPVNVDAWRKGRIEFLDEKPAGTWRVHEPANDRLGRGSTHTGMGHDKHLTSDPAD